MMSAPHDTGVRAEVSLAALGRQRSAEAVAQQQEEARWHRRSFWLGAARLLVFALFTVAFVQTVRVSLWWGLLGMLPLALLFASLVLLHLRVRAREERARRRRLLALECLARLQGGHGPGVATLLPATPCSALDAGSATVVNEGAMHALDPWAADDLGIDGEPPSLFTLLNTTQTSLGARRLRLLVRTPLLETGAIRARQEAVAELAADTAQRDALMLAACAGRSLRLERIPAFLARNAVLPGGRTRVTLAAFAVAVAILLGVGMAFRFLLPLAGLAFMALFALAWPLRRRVGSVREAWLELEPLLRVTQEVAQVLAAREPQSAVLRAQRDVFLQASAPGACLPRTLRLVRLLHLRDMGFLYGIIELLFAWELHWLLALESQWRRAPRALERVVEAFCDLESLVALALHQAERDGLCVPNLVDATEPLLALEAGAHPLLGHAVPNDLQLGGSARVAVVTGSNMAGKSTFLRMVALNTVLAQIGASVRAATWRSTPLRLVANINVRDSLADGKSYFLVEVERVQRILATAASDVHVLGLFDELFRGTNSSERLAASLEVARWLAARGGLFLLATHEQELARLAGAPGTDGIVALHFGEEIRGDSLVFPYRVQEGISTAHNALRWLERSGYPRDLVERARARAREVDGVA